MVCRIRLGFEFIIADYVYMHSSCQKKRMPLIAGASSFGFNCKLCSSSLDDLGDGSINLFQFIFITFIK